MNQVAIARRKRFFQEFVGQGMTSATKALLAHSPHLTYGSARATAHRLLADINSRPEFVEEKAKIAELEELDQIATSFVRDANKPDQTRLKALELQYRRKGALIDRNINTNTNIDGNKEAIKRAAEEALLEMTNGQNEPILKSDSVINQ